MSLTYGFYNSINKDRLYNAIQFSQIFDGVINDGVYMSVLNYFTVRPASGMGIYVGGGRAWFNHTWTYNDSDMHMVIDEAEIAAKRIDAVVIKVDTRDTVRTNSIEIVKGTPSENPVKPDLPDGNGVYYHPLAYISLDAGVTEITAAMIENAVGVNPKTPFVTGIIETINAEELLTQWGAEWTDWNNEHRQAYLDWVAQQEQDMADWTADQQQLYLDWVATQEQAYENWVDTKESEYDSWVADSEAAYTAWTTNQQSLFLAWFDHIKGQLSDDAAGRLQNEIDDLSDELNEKLFKEAHDICNRNTRIEYDENDTISQITSTSSDFKSVSVTTFENTSTGKVITTTVTKDGWNYIETVTINNTEHTITESYTKEEAST